MSNATRHRRRIREVRAYVEVMKRWGFTVHGVEPYRRRKFIHNGGKPVKTAGH